MDNVKPYLPVISLIAEDENITSEVLKYLIDLTFVDYGATSEDPKSDKLTLKLASPSMALPKKGAKLKLAIGFDTHLVDKGVFIVDAVSLQSPPRTMTISALAAPGSNALHPFNMQSQKTRAWDNATVGEIVKTIATENGLHPSVSSELINEMPGHLDQVNENDAEFLAKLARHYGAISKATGGYWVFMLQGTGMSASNKPLPEVVVTPNGKTSWRFDHRSKSPSRTDTARGNKGTVNVPYFDAATGNTLTLKYGSGDPQLSVNHTAPNRAVAEDYIRKKQQEDARAEADKKSKQKKPKPEYLMSMSVTQPATPELLTLTPESEVITDGFDPQADRTWVVDNIAFSLSPSQGMVVSMDLKR